MVLGLRPKSCPDFFVHLKKWVFFLRLASWGYQICAPFLGGVKRSGRHHHVMRFCFRNRFELKAPPKTNECPLKRDYFSREYIFEPLISRGHVSFPGGSTHFYWWEWSFNATCKAQPEKEKNSAGKEGCGRVPFPFQVPYMGAISYRWRKQSRQPIQVGDYATIYDQFQRTSRVVRRFLEASTQRFVNFVTHLCHSPSTVSHSSTVCTSA